jgi:hypothetical protein
MRLPASLYIRILTFQDTFGHPLYWLPLQTSAKIGLRRTAPETDEEGDSSGLLVVNSSYFCLKTTLQT